MTIYDFVKPYNNGFRRVDGDVGVEIETETAEPYNDPEFTFWNVVADGSLRNYGREYVLKQPVKFEKELPAALEEFGAKTKKLKFLDSSSTSVHVHVNMLNSTFLQMGNFLTLYTLFENPLIHYSGPTRRSNLFCLPIKDAEETYLNIVQMVQHMKAKNYKGLMYTENAVKYAALNLSSFRNFGSLEVRSFRGATKKDEIADWLKVVENLVSYSRQKDLSPPMIMEKWRTGGLKLMDEVFADTREKLKLENEEKLIDHNCFYAGSIAFAIKPEEWAELDKAREEKKITAAQLNKMAYQYFNADFSTLDAAQQQFVALAAKKAAGNSPHSKVDIDMEAMTARMAERTRAMQAEVNENPIPLEPGQAATTGTRARAATPRALLQPRIQHEDGRLLTGYSRQDLVDRALPHVRVEMEGDFDLVNVFSDNQDTTVSFHIRHRDGYTMYFDDRHEYPVSIHTGNRAAPVIAEEWIWDDDELARNTMHDAYENEMER